MRKELYSMLCDRLCRLYRLPDGSLYKYVEEDERNGKKVPEGAVRAIRHIDLWNHNVEFIEQEESWERPAVFVEFCPIQWKAIAPAHEYHAAPLVKLHVVTDWEGDVSEGSRFKEKALELFDLLDEIHRLLTCTDGNTFLQFDLVESQTNHNHEDIVENIEVYQCMAIKSFD